MVMFYEQNCLLAERIVDPEVEKKVDIGFPQLTFTSKSEKRKERVAHVKLQRNSTELEQRARKQTRMITYFTTNFKF